MTEFLLAFRDLDNAESDTIYYAIGIGRDAETARDEFMAEYLKYADEENPGKVEWVGYRPIEALWDLGSALLSFGATS